MDTRRQTFLDQANRITEHEAERRLPLAALLTGSAAWGTLSARSDIDIIFVTGERGVVSYRYYLPELTGIPIRTEVGRIPLAHLERVLAAGYGDDISTGLREQIRNARVLLGDAKTAESLIARFRDLKPKKKLLGEYLFQAGEALAKARESLAAEGRTGSSPHRVAEAALALDAFSKNLWRLLLVAKHRVGVQKDKHEIKAAKSALGEADAAAYHVSRRISDLDKQSALAALRAAERVISIVLSRAGVSPRIVGAIEED